jgi:hypothetical protein
MKRSARRSPFPGCHAAAPLALFGLLVCCAESPENGDAGFANTPGNVFGDAGVGGNTAGASPGTGGASGDGSVAPGSPGAGGSSDAGGQNGDGGTRDGGGLDASGLEAGALDAAATSDAGVSAGPCTLKPNKDGWVDVASNGANVQGSVFTYASKASVIMPLTTATTPFTNAGDGRLCVKGEAAKVLEMDFATYFGVGMAFDLCQASSTMPTKYTISTCPLGKTLSGLRFKVSGTTIPSELRVQFHEAGREQSAYVLATPGANTALFKDGKVAYDMTAPMINVANIDSVHFVVPTNEQSAVPFDFCVEQIELITSSGSCSGSGAGDAGMSDASVSDAGRADASTPDAGGGGSCARASAWTTSDRYGSRNYGKYAVRNNFWNQGSGGAGNQTLWANSERCWGIDANHTDPGAAGNVKSYPDVQRGWGIGTAGFPNAQHGLAIQVSQLTKAKVRWSMQAPNSGRTWALWDVYFHENATPSADKAPVNLMIQQRIVDSSMWMQNQSAGWKKVTIAGVTFREKLETATVSSTRSRIQLFVDGGSGAVLGRDDMTLDLKAVIDYYVQQGQLRSSDFLTSIQAGFEIVEGGTYQTNEFWTAVQGEADGP